MDTNINYMNFPAILNNKENHKVLEDKFYSKVVEKIKSDFTEEQQKWYMANMYMYLNYHPTNDFPIDLETIWKMLGFANKGNSKRTLENNFIKGEDFHISLLPTEKQVHGGANKETITLNTDTFKNMCMLAKTDAGKEVRKYYVKLENIYNEVLKEELDNNKETIELLKNKPLTVGFYDRKSGFIYVVKDNSKPGHFKIGLSVNTHKRLNQLNNASSTASLEVYIALYSYDMEFAEKMIHSALKPLRIQNRLEWFFIENDQEMIYVIDTMKTCIKFIEQFNLFKLDLNEKAITKLDTIDENNVLEDFEYEKEKKLTSQKRGQTIDNKTGKYKGVFYRNDKNKWEATIKKNYEEFFLGYYETEKDGAVAYNDHAIFLNQTEGTGYTLNYIEDYKPNPRNIVLENRLRVIENKSSKYKGVHYQTDKQTYHASIWNKIHEHLGVGTEEECAVLYNKQAMYYNNHCKGEYELNVIPGHPTVTEENVYELNQQQLKNNKSSTYIGVRKQSATRYSAQITKNNKSCYIGLFKNEVDAAKAYNEEANKLNKDRKNRFYKINEIH